MTIETTLKIGQGRRKVGVTNAPENTTVARRGANVVGIIIRENVTIAAKIDPVPDRENETAVRVAIDTTTGILMIAAVVVVAAAAVVMVIPDTIIEGNTVAVVAITVAMTIADMTVVRNGNTGIRS